MPKATLSPAKKKSAKSAPSRVRKTAAPAAEIPEITTPRSNDHLHWGIFAVVSVLVAVTVIYAGRSDSSTNAATAPSPVSRSASTAADAPAYVPEPTRGDAAAQQGVIGIVTAVSEKTITIKSIAPVKDGVGIGTPYTITVTPNTRFVYHPLTSEKDATAKTFGTQAGALEDIKEGMYASAITTVDVATVTAFETSEINYSEVSPLE